VSGMVRSALVAVSFGLLGLTGCGSDATTAGPAPQQATDPDAAAKEATFKSDIAPIFANCAFCHHAGLTWSFDITQPFDPVNGIINRPSTWPNSRAKLIVDPGNVDNSFIVDKVERTDLDVHVEGNPMPWNIPMLDATSIATIRQWIQDGAKDDDVYTSSIAPIFGDGVSLGSRGGSCAYCHYQGTIQPPDLTHPFDTTTGIVNVVGVHGTRVVPGNPDGSALVKKIEGQAGAGPAMPYQQPRLDPSQVAALKSWIAAGAKND
jgi:hypothetical protein